MGFLDNIKSFVHSITTEDHYATYDSPYKNAVINGSSNNISGNGSSSRLNELNRLATMNSSSHSLVRNSNNNSSTNVGYRPGLRSSQANSTTELPLQTLNNQGQSPLPSMDSLWDRIEAWLEEEFPELEDTLNNGVTTADLNEFESDLGCGQLPTEFRQFYKRHDGQFGGVKATGLIMGLVLLDLEGIVEEHTVWQKVSERFEKQQMALQYARQRPAEGSSNDANAKVINSFLSNQRSLPPNSIQPSYSHRGWIPIIKDDCGNQIAIDLAPGPNGTWGQVIIFGRDYDTKLVIALSFQEFIFTFVNDLENGNYKIDDNSEKDGFLDNSRDDFDYAYGKEEEDGGKLSFKDLDGKEFGNSIVGKDLSYLDILKLRALKTYGLTENFTTSFVPTPVKKPQEKNLPTPPLKDPLSADTSLLDSEKARNVSFPKETLIDESQQDPESVDPKDSAPKSEPKLVPELSESTTEKELPDLKKESSQEVAKEEKETGTSEEIKEAQVESSIAEEPVAEESKTDEENLKKEPEEKEPEEKEPEEKDTETENENTKKESKSVNEIADDMKEVEL